MKEGYSFLTVSVTLECLFQNLAWPICFSFRPRLYWFQSLCDTKTTKNTI